MTSYANESWRCMDSGAMLSPCFLHGVIGFYIICTLHTQRLLNYGLAYVCSSASPDSISDSLFSGFSLVCFGIRSLHLHALGYGATTKRRWAAMIFSATRRTRGCRREGSTR